MNSKLGTMSRTGTAITAIALGCACFGQVFVESTFDTSADGWKIVDFPTEGGPYVFPSNEYPVSWAGSNGNPGGHIFRADPSSGIFFFEAPAKFLGDISPAYGGVLEFDIKSTHQNYTRDNVVALVGYIAGTRRAIVATIDPVPPASWRHYVVGLVPRHFRYDSKNGGAVSQADFQSVVTNLLALRISGEYGSAVIETTSLDNVRIATNSLLAVQCCAAVTLDGIPGCRYRIEYAEELGTTNWIGLTNVTVTTSPYIYFDHDSIDRPRRYYRAVQLP